MEIQRTNQNNYHLIASFLKRIPSIDEIKTEFIDNSSILLNSLTNEILGIVAYEQFGKYGLIRYFIFQKNIEKEQVNALFLDLVDHAKSLGIKQVISVIQKDELLSIFTTFGLNPINNEQIYLNETPFKDTDFHDAKVLIFTC